MLQGAPLRLTLMAVVGLYLAHSLPLYFFNVALPAILRVQGVDLRWIGLLSLLFLPWAFKFFWAPWVDRHYVARLGRRRTWLIFTQLAVVAGVVALALTEMQFGLWVFILLGAWISTCAATQDIAIDGYAVEAFPAAQYSLASTAQSIGVALGSLVGGAGTLWLYQLFGWQTALLSLAGLIALTMFALGRVNDAGAFDDASLMRFKPSLGRVFSRPEIRRLLLVIVVYRVVEAPAMAMLNPMLIDANWSLGSVGLLFSVFGAGVGLLAAVTGGWLVKRDGATRWLLGAGRLRTVAYGLLAMILIAGWLNTWTLGAAVLAILAIRYLAMTALYAHFMQHCSRQQAGTDFTVLVCFELLVYFLGSALSGFLAKALGYGGFFLVLTLFSAVSVLLSQRLIRPAVSPL